MDVAAVDRGCALLLPNTKKPFLETFPWRCIILSPEYFWGLIWAVIWGRNFVDIADSFLEGFRWDFFSQEQNSLIYPIPESCCSWFVAREDRMVIPSWRTVSNIPSSGMSGFIPEFQGSGKQSFLNSSSLDGLSLTAFLPAKNSAPGFRSLLPKSCSNSLVPRLCRARRVCLLCCGALIYLKSKSGRQRKRINKLLPLVKVTAGICPPFVAVWWW